MSTKSTTKAATSFWPPSFDLGAGAVTQGHLEPREGDSLGREHFFVPRSEEVWGLDSILAYSCPPSTDVQHNSRAPRIDPSLDLATTQAGSRAPTEPVRHDVRQPLPELIVTRRCSRMTNAKSVFSEPPTVVGKVDGKPRSLSRALLVAHSDSVSPPSRSISPSFGRPTPPSLRELVVDKTVSKVFKQRREIDEHEMRLKNEFKELHNVLSIKIVEIAAEVASLGLDDSFGLRDSLARLKDLSATTARNSDVLERDPDMMLSVMRNEIRRIFDEIEVARSKIAGSFLR